MSGQRAAPGGVRRPDAALTDALRLLGKRRLVVAIHDGSFPGAAAADIGRGSPYGEGAGAFLAFAAGLGFNAVQLGPQGQTGRDNPSPYDATLFSRNTLNLDLAGLTDGEEARPPWAALLRVDTLRRLAAACPAASRWHSDHAYAFDACHAALDEIHRNFAERRRRGLAGALELDAALAAFSARHRHWLEADALYHVLAAGHGGRHHRDWPTSDASCPDRFLYRPAADRRARCEARRSELHGTHRHAIERYRLGQFILDRQHALLHATAKRLGLRLYGDLQIGMSACDEWSRGALLLDGYRMGAPPSRTNPNGQPWGYGVLDPDQYLDAGGTPGPVLRFVLALVAHLLAAYDGLRIDHPHGWVCPWVYRRDLPDPYHAVCHGARLFSSPDRPDHPELARYAIVRPEQLDRSVPPCADDWVRTLEPGQVERYAVLLDTLLSAVRAREDVSCEVLSTLPFPLARVLERRGMGRYRVTQKADLDNPRDVYRAENARPQDWIMVGNHDTPSIWLLAEQWLRDGEARRQAGYLAARLVPEPEREVFARELAADRRKLVHAKVADALASRAAYTLVFFADLLGLRATYNRPGVTAPDNWTLRVPPDYAERYRQAAARGEALNLPCVLALALRARGVEFARAHRGLIARLRRLAGWNVGPAESRR